MASKLSNIYPGKVTVDANNPDGTFKNRTSDILKDGTPFEKIWSSDVWGFLSMILFKASITPDGSEENINASQLYDALEIEMLKRQRALINGLICLWVSITTIDIDITSVKWRGFDTALNVTWDAAGGIALNGWDDSGDARVSTAAKHFIWLLQKDSDGTLATVAAYDKTAPDITNAAFDGYSIVTLLTHFVLDGSSDIIKFSKIGNKWGLFEDFIIGTTTSTTYVNHSTLGVIPAIDDIESIDILFGGVCSITPEGTGVSKSLSIDGVNDLEIVKHLTSVAASDNFTYIPHSLIRNDSYSTKGEFTSMTTSIAIYGCVYNNIKGI